jgi:hypothetical protein
MNRPLPLVLLLALCLAACGEPAAQSDDDDSIDGAPGGDLSSFHQDAADAVCGALFRCCDGEDVGAFFEAWTVNEQLADFAPQLPPDEQACPALVADMIAITPFGDWIDAASSGAVDFDPDAQSTCLAALRDATCGDGVRAALYDSTCFSLAAPYGGEQRSMFERTGIDGDACSPIRDGVGASFYGTCAPDQSFCCYDDPACTYPYDGDTGAPRDGSCRPASGVGGPCLASAPLQLCASGLECVSGQCEEPLTAPLQQGEVCIQDFVLLGECQDSWCDLFGSGLCEPLRDLGEGCGGDQECSTGACDGVCVENDFCSGS